VPYVSVAAYKVVKPWNVFGRIETIGDVPITEKCATPSIDYENGDISFFCETKGVEFVYNFATPSESDEDGKGINMPNKLQVSVYAKKDGFENSDVATKEIDLGTSGIRGDLNGDGVVNMPDAMFIVNKILEGEFPDETPDIKPIDLTAYIQLPSSFIPYLSNSDELAASCGDENRGTGTLIDGVWCIRIRGNVGDKITLRYYCATNRLIYNSTETIELKGDVNLGTFDDPRIIDFNLDNSTR
jgi:hypothetical protein